MDLFLLFLRLACGEPSVPSPRMDASAAAEERVWRGAGDGGVEDTAAAERLLLVRFCSTLSSMAMLVAGAAAAAATTVVDRLGVGSSRLALDRLAAMGVGAEACKSGLLLSHWIHGLEPLVPCWLAAAAPSSASSSACSWRRCAGVREYFPSSFCSESASSAFSPRVRFLSVAAAGTAFAAGVAAAAVVLARAGSAASVSIAAAVDAAAASRPPRTENWMAGMRATLRGETRAREAAAEGVATTAAAGAGVSAACRAAAPKFAPRP